MLPFAPRLIVEPDDGLQPVREFILSAEESLLIKQFTFTEESFIQAVIDRKNAGVNVRVMLNPERRDGEKENHDSRKALLAAGVHVIDSNP